MTKSFTTLVLVLTGLIAAAQSEISNTNYTRKQAAVIIEYSKNGILQLDFLEYNSNFKPGADGEEGNYVLNKDKKLRKFKLAKSAKYYECNGGTIASMEKPLSVLYTDWDDKNKYDGCWGFDFKNGEIVAIYQQCLP
ncbi:MAG: hypothetical protein ACT4ON_02640 [Bacteroidota bacterium]